MAVHLEQMMLGSTALRGEPDTTLALYDDAQQRVIASETRIGRNIPLTVLRAAIVESAGANVVSEFSLDMPFSKRKEKVSEKAERGQKASHEDRIITFLRGRPNLSATVVLTLDEVEEKNKYKIMQ
jgi:hypothetical protein